MDLAFELHDLVRTLDAEAERILRPEGLSYHQYVALVILDQHPGITSRRLAGGLGVTEAACSGIVKTLLGSNLVANQAPQGAGNRRELHITSAGSDKLSQCSELLGHSLDNTSRQIGIDPEHLAATIRTLHDELGTSTFVKKEESS